jgi:hypothetical protein
MRTTNDTFMDIVFVSDQPTITVEEIWVSTGEGAEITGYHRDHVQKLARDNWKLPEDERLIRGIRKRKWGYDIWLPDLVRYIEGHGHGPFKKTPK